MSITTVALVFLLLMQTLYANDFAPRYSTRLYGDEPLHNRLQRPNNKLQATSKAREQAKAGLEEYSIYSFEESLSSPIGAVSSQSSRSTVRSGGSEVQREKELLYEAYNLLHTLAQDFQKPFDAPAVIVVGHQTSGKSALIEALMGFQFNQVGGGTKTRRPVALRMQYNPNCIAPVCFLTTESGKEEQRSLADIQAYIEAENRRLERDPTRSFDPREINVRMEYRYCPNMIVIDTPGMIHPPKGRQLTPQQRALAHASREAESLVLDKIRCQDYIILCVEDTTDWKHATTRNVVMQADPQLLRTVLVTTKLDTKLPQFSEAEDLDDFLRAPLVQRLFSQLLGGPFFTSVPAGRVGLGREFDSNMAFVRALRETERGDRALAASRLGPQRAKACLPRVGVSRLRSFLETRVEDCYRRNVAKIVPLLQSELRHAESRLQLVEKELQGLSVEHLRLMANSYREAFSKQLDNAIQGTVRASPEEWGETLDAEAVRSGSFLQPGQTQLSESWQRVLDLEVGNADHKLFGGAQYHRAIREFTLAVRHMPTPVVSEDEIANAAGMGDRHNGVNFMRAACVIAMEKAQMSFEPMLEALRCRLEHVMKRLYPVVMELVEKNAHYYHASSLLGGSAGAGAEADAAAAAALDAHSAPFQQVMRSIYDKFVEQQMELCLRKCRDDLHGMTRFVTWDVEDKGGSSALYRMLPTPQKMVEIYNVAVDKQHQHRQYPQEDEQYQQLHDGYGEVTLDHDYAEDGGAGAGERGQRGGDPVSTQVLDDWNRANDKGGKRSAEGSGKSSASNPSKQRRGRRFWGLGGSNSDSEAAAPTEEEKEPRHKANTGRLQPQQNMQQEQELALSPSKGAAEEDAELSDYYRVMQLTEEMLQGTSASRTSALVTSLVHFIVSSWRNHFARSTAMKFNCFFLMPFMDDFPVYLRNELDRVYESGVGEMFDIAETRRALQAKRAELLAECAANSKLQRRFDSIAAQLQGATTAGASTASVASSSSNGKRNKQQSAQSRASGRTAATANLGEIGGRPYNSPKAAARSNGAYRDFESDGAATSAAVLDRTAVGVDEEGGVEGDEDGEDSWDDLLELFRPGRGSGGDAV